jgi:HrpA-like RNA helicase
MCIVNCLFLYKAQERGQCIGRHGCQIGYSVRFDEVRPICRWDEGRVVFCTSGILLQRLQKDPRLKTVTHLILDEVHERDLVCD